MLPATVGGVTSDMRWGGRAVRVAVRMTLRRARGAVERRARGAVERRVRRVRRVRMASVVWMVRSASALARVSPPRVLMAGRASTAPGEARPNADPSTLGYRVQPTTILGLGSSLESRVQPRARLPRPAGSR